jgi:hypothetical protein
VKIYPAIIRNRKHAIPMPPKHWGLDPVHLVSLSSWLSSQRSELTAFSGNASLNQLFDVIGTRLRPLSMFVKHLPLFSPIVKKGEVFHALFSKETVYLLLKYCWYSVLYEYVLGAQDPAIAAVSRRLVNQQRRETAREMAQQEETLMNEMFGQEEFEEDSVENLEGVSMLREVEIELGDLREVQDQVGRLLVQFIRYDVSTKTATNMSYSDVRFKTQRKRDKEKKQITDSFERMERDERKVEDMLKHFKIGRWNLGQQKSLIQYSSETYSRQTELNNYLNAEDDADGILLSANPAMQTNEEGEEGMDLEDLERESEEDIRREQDAEAYDIGGLDEDYLDGNYYEEDMEDPFSED